MEGLEIETTTTTLVTVYAWYTYNSTHMIVTILL
jgi:hypothetical protein